MGIALVFYFMHLMQFFTKYIGPATNNKPSVFMTDHKDRAAYLALLSFWRTTGHKYEEVPASCIKKLFPYKLKWCINDILRWPN
jgi:hypothetical protein